MSEDMTRAIEWLEADYDRLLTIKLVPLNEDFHRITTTVAIWDHSIRGNRQGRSGGGGMMFSIKGDSVPYHALFTQNAGLPREDSDAHRTAHP